MSDSTYRFRKYRAVIILALMILVLACLLLVYRLISGDEEPIGANLPTTVTRITAQEDAQPATPSELRSEASAAATETPSAPISSSPTNQSVPGATPTATSTTPVATLAPTAVPSPPVTPTMAAASWKAVDESQVEAVLSDLTLEQKVGQMLMVGLPGPSLDEQARQRIVDMGVGGVILLERNTTSPEQVREFTRSLQDLATNQGAGLPLFVGWNHEGGSVVRRAAGLTQFPANMAIGTLGQPDTAFDVGRATAEEMLSLGVNMNFAPVLDVNNEPTNPVIGLRSYGASPELVAAHGRNFILGQHQAGVIAVAKHFPGHGGVDVDSHLALPVLNSSLDSLEQTELPPFRAAFDAGIAAVMVAHINIPALDPSGRPASLSGNVVDGLLRNQLGFDGLIMTDALGMQAITDQYAIEEGAIQAVIAGNDLLLTVETSDRPEAIHRELVAAVRSGRVPESRIDESVRRLIRLKLSAPLVPGRADPVLPQHDEHRALAKNLAQAAVKLIQDEKGWLPLSNPSEVVLLTPARLNPGTIAGDQISALGEMLAQQGFDVTEVSYNHRSPADIAAAQSLALSLTESADAFVVVTWDAILRHAHNQETAQEELVDALLATGKPVVTVFGQLPYDQMRLGHAPAQIAMYGDTEGQIEGVVRLLLTGR